MRTAQNMDVSMVDFEISSIYVCQLQKLEEERDNNLQSKLYRTINVRDKKPLNYIFCNFAQASSFAHIALNPDMTYRFIDGRSYDSFPRGFARNRSMCGQRDSHHTCYAPQKEEPGASVITGPSTSGLVMTPWVDLREHFQRIVQ